MTNVEICAKSFTKRELKKLQKAIEQQYYFEFEIGSCRRSDCTLHHNNKHTDDMAVRGFIGSVEETSVFPHQHDTLLFTHVHFKIQFNKNHVCLILATRHIS